MLSSEEKSKFFNAQQYLQASKNLIEGMLKTGNPSVLISNHEISENELTEHLKYSSNSIILPAMFCFYQGLELIIKGFVSIKEQLKVSHDAEQLYKKFLNLYPSSNNLSCLFNKYINNPPSFISDYKKSNNINSVSKLYTSFRYPDEIKNQLCDYYPLKYPDNDSFLPQLNELHSDIDLILKYSVSLFRELDTKPCDS